MRTTNTPAPEQAPRTLISQLKTRALQCFQMGLPPLSTRERWRASIGAFLFITLSGMLLYHWPVGHHWLLAPMGASAVILYLMPHTPVAAPWPVVGSYLAGTVAAFVSVALIPYPPLAAAAAVAGSIWLMARLRCIHPPGGALALFLALAAPYGPGQMWDLGLSQLSNMLLALILAVLINNLLLRRHYPWRPDLAPSPHHTRDVAPQQRVGLQHEDLDFALKQTDSFVDVQESELVSIYNLAVEHAFERHLGTTCQDLMSRDLITAQFGTPLAEAWSQLRHHQIRALPVVDPFGRLQGIVTTTDFLRQLGDAPFPTLKQRLWQLLERNPGLRSERAEVVGQIMTKVVYTAKVDTAITDLVQAIASCGIHHIPVLDEGRRLVGMITPTDINAALYHQVALYASE